MSPGIQENGVSIQKKGAQLISCVKLRLPGPGR